MSVWQAIRGALADGRGEEGRKACFSCAHFTDDPALLEAELPGLAALSSAHASVRAQDGLCRRHDRLTNGRGGCAAFQ